MWRPPKISVAMTKAFLAVNGGTGAASARVRSARYSVCPVKGMPASLITDFCTGAVTIALSVLARPVRRSAFLFGKWLGLVAFGTGFVVLAGLAQCLVVWATVDYWPPDPAAALALLAAQTTVLLTLAVLLSTAISPMASGVIAVGLFCTTWVAGVVGGIGASLDNDAVARVGTVSRMLLPTDGLWRGAMNAFQDPSAFVFFGDDGGEAEYASVPLSVAGEDLANVVILTSKGGPASGRVVFEGNAQPPSVSGIRITAVPADPPFGAV